MLPFTMNSSFDNLPGAEIIKKGLQDLEKNEETLESLLVSIASPRLRRLGFQVNHPYSDAENKAYRLLAKNNPDNAHSQYNAFIRLLVSFSRAFENTYLAGTG